MSQMIMSVVAPSFHINSQIIIYFLPINQIASLFPTYFSTSLPQESLMDVEQSLLVLSPSAFPY